MEKFDSPQEEGFWKLLEPVIFPIQRIEQGKVEVQQILHLTKLSAPAAVLDLCCGLGRHSIELARRGFQVTGVDKTKYYLEKARQKALKEELPLELVQCEMKEFIRPESFNAALSMFTSFGYYENLEDDRLVLKNIFQSLKPKGFFLIELMGKEILARIFQARDWIEIGNSYLLQERRVSKDWGWMHNHWILIQEGNTYPLEFGHRIYSSTELYWMLKDCGFNEIEIYGNLDGGPYNHIAHRLVVVARK